MMEQREPRRIVLAGGSGHLGRLLADALSQQGDEIVVLSREVAKQPGWVTWDGRTAGGWVNAIDGADVVINLAGRSVNCRYTPDHLREMWDSRIDSTRAIGAAFAAAQRPPRVWLQMSTATIYAHTFEHANDERSGLIGGGEPGVPAYWRRSVQIAQAWEAAMAEAATPHTRTVALRTAMVMSTADGGPFNTLLNLARLGLGGPITGGRQYISWIHAQDFVRAVGFLMDADDVAGPVNLAAPNPLSQCDFMAALRAALGMPIGLPATRWMAEIGAFLLRTDTELVLKSRRVVPGRLLEGGFRFMFPDWPVAARDLVERWRLEATPARAGSWPARPHHLGSRS